MCLLVLHCWSASAGGIGAGELACVQAWPLVCRVVCFKNDGCRPESVRRVGDSPRVSLCGRFHDSGLPMIVCMSGLHLVALSLLVDVVHFWLPCTYLLFSCLCFWVAWHIRPEAIWGHIVSLIHRCARSFPSAPSGSGLGQRGGPCS